MPALSEHVNVWRSALNILAAKGYQVWVQDDGETFCAERDGWDFMADSPVSLLGLVSMLEHQSPEHYEEYWWRTPGKLDVSKLPSEPKPYVSVVKGPRQRGPAE
ncbi:hypothetical protein [Nannocystis bainbridge]|uniref:Uncharacterized protein n=1 Tax=Nannocystis bainbridge TaxID=2995303 RepID=A0ABT5E7Z0_9BACT|nr:hypothetical protein [Nannocystis bainbridge]MDC0721969.1 hypothetical protein [Nannocystis bainbridge]